MRYLILVLLFISCQPKSTDDTSIDQSFTEIPMDYATGFQIFWSENNIYEIIINRPYQNAKDSLHYLLVPSGAEVPPHSANVTLIRTPIERIVCTSTTHIPLLDYLDVTQTLVGFPTPDYISSEKMRKEIDAGHVKDLGVDKSLNIEMLLELDPDMVMTYSISGNDPVTRQLRDLGIPVLINGEYLEEHPLGRVEWIRLAGLLFNKLEESDSVFRMIRSNYDKMRALVSEVQDRPSAFSGVMYGDTWFLPGGRNYAAKMMEDAGINYLWRNNDSPGFLELSFESVLDRAHIADLWIGVASFQTLTALLNEDERYGLFKAFRSGNVFTYDARKGTKGGSEYLELGYLRPDIILSDLLQIAHPEQFGRDSLYFHAKLNP